MLGLQSLRHGLCDSPGQSGKALPRQQCLSCGQNEQGSQLQTRKNSERSWGVGVACWAQVGEGLPSEERQEAGPGGVGAEPEESVGHTEASQMPC